MKYCSSYPHCVHSTYVLDASILHTIALFTPPHARHAIGIVNAVCVTVEMQSNFQTGPQPSRANLIRTRS